MSDFRIWLYKEKVIPEICKQTNEIIEYATNTDQYKLTGDIEINNIKNGSIRFNWFINNGNTNIIIESSGGFRKFITGLSLRIALNKLGASSIHCKQLFIDEGFVSADSDNLDLIPDFLRSLLNIYGSIILVSHLETLKEQDSKEINIIKLTKTIKQLLVGNKIENEPNICQDRSRSISSLSNSDMNICDDKCKIVNVQSIINDKCKATTQKGTKCSRKGIYNGYCKTHLV